MRRATTLLFLAALSVAALGQTAQASTITWDGSDSTDWTDGANWVGGVAPADDTTTDVAYFDTATPNQPSLAGARSVAGITFSSTLTGGWNLSGAGTLTITTGSTNTVGPIQSFNTSGTNTISLAGLVIGGNSPSYGLTFQMASGATLEISSLISGVEGINRNGSTATLILSNAANTYTGHTWIQRGTVAVNSLADYGTASSLGAESDPDLSEIYMGGSSGSLPLLRYRGSGGSTNRRINLEGSATPTYSIYSEGTGPITFTGTIVGTTTGASARTFALRGTNTGDNTISGVIPNATGGPAIFGVTKNDAGKWILGGANTYTGPTTVSAGTLLVNGSLSTGTVAVNAGVFGGTGTIGGPVTIASLATLAPGASVGTLTLSNSLTLDSGSLLDFELAAVGASDQVSMTSSTLNLNGQQFSDFTFTPLGGFGIGTYTLFDAGTISGTLGGSLSGLVGGFSSTLAISGTDVVLNVVPEPGTLALLATGLMGLLVYAWRKRK